jgi:predicted dehydrogenase
MSTKLRVGFAGVRRASSFVSAFRAHPDTQVAAFCDLVADRAREAAAAHGAEAYPEFEAMLDRGRLNAVLIATPMPCHTPQAIQALERGIHVLSEVPAAVSMEESRALALAATRSRALYMMAENYCYMRPNVLLGAVIQAGLLGEVYFAEGEYVHELKELNELTPWRRRWQTGINGCTYPTHSLGPILQWLQTQRVTAVSCVGSGQHYRDPRGDLYEQEDSVLMLCRLSGGGLAKIRLDMLSERPHAMTNYAAQGTRGAYESARAYGETNRIWIAGRSPDKNRWDRLEAFESEFLPGSWRNPPPEALAAGHGGGDYFEVVDFVNAALGRAPCPIGIHRALDMTLPGLVSQESIAQGGAWLPVPDSRTWTTPCPAAP